LALGDEPAAARQPAAGRQRRRRDRVARLV
jgi:hypothetical protein